MCAVLFKPVANSYYLITTYADFKPKRAYVLREMPKPRRKKWWELLEDSKHDKYYQAASIIMKIAPP